MEIHNLSTFDWGAEFPGLDKPCKALIVPAKGAVELADFAASVGIPEDTLLADLRGRHDVRQAVEMGRITIPGLSRTLTAAESKADAERRATAEAERVKALAEAERVAKMEAELAALRLRVAKLDTVAP
jgi:hypothetical protein